MSGLNNEQTDKAKLVAEILDFIARVIHPERLGKPNSQIAYTDDEIRMAQLADIYTTSDGYIFDAKDIISDEGDAYVTPHLGHSHWIGKDSLSEKEKAAAQAYTKEKGIRPPEADAANKANPKGESAAAIYERVVGEKRIPVVRLPYNVEHTVAVSSSHTRIITTTSNLPGLMIKVIKRPMAIPWRTSLRPSSTMWNIQTSGHSRQMAGAMLVSMY